MSDRSNIQEFANAWGDITMERFHMKLDALKIGYSLQLEDSLTLEMMSSGADVSRIEFSFNYYGKFVDMGVGRGMSLGEVAEGGISRRLVGREDGNRRRAKKWFSPVFYTEVTKLKHLLAEKFARKAVLTIVENMDDNALKWGEIKV